MASSRPQVLVAVQPRLAADLIRRGLLGDAVDVTIARGLRWWFRTWDIAVLSDERWLPVRARCVVALPAQVPPNTFERLLRAIAAGECFAF
jgi:hypothetical protein